MAGFVDGTEQGRRIEERHGVLLDAVVRAYRQPPLAATMLDISGGGAMLKADTAALLPGDEVTLAVRAVEAVATVAWVREDFFGLAFHRRLDPLPLAGLRKAARL